MGGVLTKEIEILGGNPTARRPAVRRSADPRQVVAFLSAIPIYSSESFSQEPFSPWHSIGHPGARRLG